MADRADCSGQIHVVARLVIIYQNSFSASTYRAIDTVAGDNILNGSSPIEDVRIVVPYCRHNAHGDGDAGCHLRSPAIEYKRRLAAAILPNDIIFATGPLDGAHVAGVNIAIPAIDLGTWSKAVC